MEPTATFTLTEKEAVALSNLIDIAVKSAGIQSAGAAAHLHQKLFDACSIFRKEEPAPLVDAEVVS
jgi:hypothetical protein